MHLDGPIKEGYVYSDRNYIALLTPSILFGVGILMLLFAFIHPFFSKGVLDYLFIVVYFGFGLFAVWYGGKKLIRRKLQINNWGIQYFIGEKLELGVSWKNVGIIESGYDPIARAIFVIKKGSKYAYPIEKISGKQLHEAFKIMVDYANKYDIQIKDKFNWLSM
jgi:hypothetical protein